MRLRVRAVVGAVFFALAAAAGGSAATPSFAVLAPDGGSWPQLLSSIGLQPDAAAEAQVLVARAGAAYSAEMAERVARGAILVLEGSSPLAEGFGFKVTATKAVVNSLVDAHNSGQSILWEKGVELPVFEVPDGAQVFARERWSAAPLTAGFRRGAGAVLWVAADPGARGYERFPYLLNALCDLGLEPPFRSDRLWAFFDSSYRLRVDVDYFAARWRKAGIAALHVAAWHFYDADAEQDAYLEKLIAACHRQGIQVYAWLELPHVSEKFWADHPEWREKTALLQDAQLDWRKLMNLTNRDCFRAVSAGVKRLVERFDWDGVNLAELYFESLEGIDNPARFTPMNDDVRSQFRARYGYDPLELFHGRKDAASRKQFLDFRAELARKMQEDWLAEVEAMRRAKPDLDLTLTHVDDRFDAGMRDAIGADAARALPLLDHHSFTFLIEDPATIWNLGPQRYQTLAERYAALTPRRDRLAIDLNVVERYQDVYPTKQQTGAELFELVHQAAAGFARVALYFESSLQAADLKLLPFAAAAGGHEEVSRGQTTVESSAGAGVPWKGGATVDGAPWPVGDGETVWLPPGRHTVAAGTAAPLLEWLNAELENAKTPSAGTLEFSYRSAGRAFAVLSGAPVRVRVDGAPQQPKLAGPRTLILPSGRHSVQVTEAEAAAAAR
ncbi:MAG TPA: hypothetical protein VMU19_05555 [Bryobacteraceae bacterium]|nr:hypothetical protein [Bryobacteraceae bacterium]